MKLEILVNIISGIFSLYGTYCMSKSILSLEPKEILKSHPSYSDIMHSLEEVTSIIRNRIETLKGLLFICLGVSVQISNYFFVESWKASLVDTSIVNVAIVLLIILNVKIEQCSNNAVRSKVIETNKYYVREKINSIDNKVNGGIIEFLNIKPLAEYYFELYQDENEEITKYLNRISDFVGAKRLY